MKRIILIFLLLQSTLSLCQIRTASFFSTATATSVITPAQKIFVTAQSSPDIGGLVQDASINDNDAQLKNGPCLTSTGSLVLNFNSLSGVVVVTTKGTASVTKSGNTLQIGSGTVYAIELSNGKIIPCMEGAGLNLFSSDGLWLVTISGETASTIWTSNTQNNYFFSYANDVSRLPYWDVKANIQVLSFNQGWADIAPGSFRKNIVIQENALQDFVVKANLTLKTTESGTEIFFANNCQSGTNANAGFYVYLNSNGTTLNLWKSTSVTVNETVTSSTFTSIKDGLPREVAIVKNGTSVSFYLNGSLVSTSTLSSATINYVTNSNNGVDTSIGSALNGLTWLSSYSTGYIYNVQIGAYSTANVTSVTSQTDLNTFTSIWRINKRILRKGVSVYDEENKGFYLAPTSGASIVYAFTPFSSGGKYGYPKGHFWAALGYKLDLSNAGANTTLTGVETNMDAADVRANSSGRFRNPYDGHELANILTYTATLTLAEQNAKLVELGYLHPKGIVIYGENWQSNTQGYNPSSTDPAPQYLAVQNAYIFADTVLSGTARIEKLRPKLNNEGIVTTSSISANIGVAYTSQTDLGPNKIIFDKYAVGGTGVKAGSSIPDWSPSHVGSGGLLDLANNYSSRCVDSLVLRGYSVDKIFLGALYLNGGEQDIYYGYNNGVDIDTYFYNDVLTVIENRIDAYRAKGVNTSQCTVIVAIPQAINLLSETPQYEKVKTALLFIGYKGLSDRPTLKAKVKGIEYVLLENQTTFPNVSTDPVHLNKQAQINLGVYIYNNILHYAFRSFLQL